MKFNIPEEFARSSGIYVIRNSINDKVYVGSAMQFRKRFNVHTSNLRKNIHHSPLLQNFVDKYGIDKLSFNIMLVCDYDKEVIYRHEQNFIDLLEACNREKGFNISTTAQGGNGGNKYGKNTCKFCKKSFNKRTKKQAYCTLECYLKVNAKRQIYKCGVCKTEFKRKGLPKRHKPHKFCSNECAAKASIKTGKMVKCPTCKKEFFSQVIGTNKRHQKHCSWECSKKRTDINCQFCGRRFFQRRIGQIVCSTACSNKLRTRKKRIQLEPITNKKGQFLIPFN